MNEFFKNLVDKPSEMLDSIFGRGALGTGIGIFIKILLIAIIGFIVAKILSAVAKAIISKTGLDDKIAGMSGKQTSGGIASAVGKVVFYVIMAFVALAILSALNLGESVTEPISGMLTKMLNAIPNILIAIVILAIAVFLATIVKSLLQGLFNTLKVDERIGSLKSQSQNKLGLDDDDNLDADYSDSNYKPISNSVCTVVYFLIILFFLPIVLEKLNIKGVTEPVNDLVSQIMGYIPNLFAGSLLLAVVYMIANIVRIILSNLLPNIGVDSIPNKLGYSYGNTTKSPSAIIATAVMVTIIIVFLPQVLRIMNLGFISEWANEKLVDTYFNLFWAVVIGLIGIFVANVVYNIFAGRNETWAKIARIIILFFFGAVALQKAEISSLSSTIFENALEYMIVALAVAIGIGGAIAIGLGGRSTVARFLDRKFD